jgi:hypothetical protein
LDFGRRKAAVRKKKGKRNPCIIKAVNLIDTQIAFVEKQLLATTAPNDSIPSGKLRWESTPIELVELLYALHEAGCFGSVSLKLLFDSAGKMFDCPIRNCYRLFWSISIRTGENRTFFLNKLRKTLSDKLVRKDSGKRK